MHTFISYTESAPPTLIPQALLSVLFPHTICGCILQKYQSSVNYYYSGMNLGLQSTGEIPVLFPACTDS